MFHLILTLSYPDDFWQKSFRQILFTNAFFLCTKDTSSGLCNRQITRMSVSHQKSHYANSAYANWLSVYALKAH